MNKTQTAEYSANDLPSDEEMVEMTKELIKNGQSTESTIL